MRIGPVLRRLRTVRRIKQQTVAEIAGVTQATVSRWESGALNPSDAQMRRLRPLLETANDLESDQGLKRLIRASPLAVHLICDVTHRLLAASPHREAEWQRSANSLAGQSLFRFATDEIRHAEARLDGLGWFDGRVSGAVFWTGAGISGLPLRIQQGHCVWERLTLNDGSPVRLVTTLLPDTVAAEARRTLVELDSRMGA